LFRRSSTKRPPAPWTDVMEAPHKSTPQLDTWFFLMIQSCFNRSLLLVIITCQACLEFCYMGILLHPGHGILLHPGHGILLHLGHGILLHPGHGILLHGHSATSWTWKSATSWARNSATWAFCYILGNLLHLGHGILLHPGHSATSWAWNSATSWAWNSATWAFCYILGMEFCYMGILLHPGHGILLHGHSATSWAWNSAISWAWNSATWAFCNILGMEFCYMGILLHPGHSATSWACMLEPFHDIRNYRGRTALTNIDIWRKPMAGTHIWKHLCCTFLGSEHHTCWHASKQLFLEKAWTVHLNTKCTYPPGISNLPRHPGKQPPFYQRRSPRAHIQAFRYLHPHLFLKVSIGDF